MYIYIYNIYIYIIYTPKTVVKHPHHHKLKHCHFWAWSIFDTTICLCCLPSISYQSKWTTLMVSTWIMSERHFVEESPDMVIKKNGPLYVGHVIYIFTWKPCLFLCHDATVRDLGDGTCTVLFFYVEGFFQIFGTANLNKKNESE